MSLYHIVYSSVASNALNQKQLAALLLNSRAKNQARRITGILLYSHEHIVQVLEGEQASVQALYESISHDPRHRDVTTLADGPAAYRVFPDWTMGFVAVAPEELRRFTGYVDPTQPNFLLPRAHNAGPELLALLKAFVSLQDVEA